jgi:S1-C subfamily serine protease
MTRKGSRACARCGLPFDAGDECRQCGAPLDAGPSGGAERDGVVPRSRQGIPARAVMIIGAISAAGAVAALLVLRRPGQELASAPAPEAPTEAPSAAPEPPALPSLAQSARRAVVATSATASCDGASAWAIVLEGKRAVTRASVPCADGKALLEFGGGRRLMALGGRTDERADVALLSLLFDAPEGLPAGASSLLSPGDPVWKVGRPDGQASTLRETRIVRVGRNVLGVAYLELDGAASWADDGRPLLDSDGRVVGIVRAGAPDGTGNGLALPIEYALDGVEPPTAMSEARKRWRAIVARVAREDRAEATRFSGRMVRPSLLAARALPGAMLGVVVGKRFADAPSPLRLEVEVRTAGRVLCRGVGLVELWELLEISIHGLLKGLPEEARARWALDRGVGRGVHVGAATVDLEGCRLAQVPEGAEVALRSGEPSDAPVPFPGGAFAAGAEARPMPAESALEARARAEREAGRQRELGKARALVGRRLAELNEVQQAALADARKAAGIPAAIDALTEAQQAHQALQRRAREEDGPPGRR